MDRNTIIGFTLIALVLMVWMWMNAPPPSKNMPTSDSLATKTHLKEDSTRSAQHVRPESLVANTPTDTLGKYFSSLADGEQKHISIETDLFRGVLSTKGGGIQSWELKKFLTWDQYPVNFLNNGKAGDFSLLFYSQDGKLINTKNLIFSSIVSDKQNIRISGNDSVKVEFVLNVSNQSRIVKTFTFRADKYEFDVSYRFEGMQNIISNFEYQVVWESGLRYFEHNSIDESNHAKSAAYAGGELTTVDAVDFEVPVHQTISGRVTWVAMRNKYFAITIIPREKESRGAELDGNKYHRPDKGAEEQYTVGLKMPFQSRPVETDRFTVYMGPLDFDIIKGFNLDLDKIMSLGFEWVIRPISEYIILPLFKFLHLFIPNFGFVLIVFSVIVKVALYPLTKSSMQSMKKMQALQPMMNEIREKHKDDPQKMNQQIMRLYKEYGVNPAGGCLPLILQMPILYALWSVFSSTIELRQASFIWWITDLSIPDVIAHLPFHIPLFGIDKISGLAILMGITMFIQQKMSVNDPRQKMMVWMMPLLMTLLFNSFPAGLNLYYFMFNLLSIAQQAWMNKHHDDKPLQKVDPAKSTGGIFNRLSKNLPNLKR